MKHKQGSSPFCLWWYSLSFYFSNQVIYSLYIEKAYSRLMKAMSGKRRVLLVWKCKFRLICPHVRWAGICSIEDSEWLKSWIMLLKCTIYVVFCRIGINYYIMIMKTLHIIIKYFTGNLLMIILLNNMMSFAMPVSDKKTTFQQMLQKIIMILK